MESIKRAIQLALDSWPGKGPSDERGAALITTLLILVMLTAIGMASVMTSSTESLISRNYRLNKLAMDHAMAGLNVAMARMDLVGTGSAISVGYNISVLNVESMGYDNSSWPVSSSDFALPPVPGGHFVNFTGLVSYKKEDPTYHWRGKGDGDAYPGTTKVLAYSRDCAYDEAPLANWERAYPVYTISMTGRVTNSEGKVIATSTVEADVTRNTLNIFAPGGIYSGECPAILGTNDITNSGEDFPEGGDVPAVISGATGCPNESQINAQITGGDGGYVSGDSKDLTTYLGYNPDQLKAFAGVIPYYTGVNEPGRQYGISVDDPAIVYYEYKGDPITSPSDESKDDVTLNNCSGYGVLIVDGDLTIGGSFTWEGLIYVFGDLTMGGGGSAPNITGAVMCGGKANLHGDVQVTYSGDTLEKVGAAGFESKLLNWRVKYEYE